MKKTKEKKIINKDAKISTYLKPKACSIFFYVLGLTLFNLLDIFAVIEIAKFLEFVTAASYDQALTSFIIMACYVATKPILMLISSYIFTYAITDMAMDIRIRLTKRAFLLDSKTYTNSNTGNFVSRLTNDPDNVFDSLDIIVDGLARIISNFIVLFYIMAINIYIGLIILTIVIILILVEIKRKKCFIKNHSAKKKKSDEIISLTTEIARSQKDIKSLGLDANLQELTFKKYDDYRKCYKRQDNVDITFWSLRRIASTLFNLVIIFIAFLLLKNWAITVASFIFIFTNKSLTQDIPWYCGAILKATGKAKVALNRMFEIYDEERYTSEVFGTKELESIKGEIEFQHVGFAYEEKQVDDNNNQIIKRKNVFNDLSFTIPENKIVAFVGKSGSGKTTIASLICKLISTETGKITIDGEDINELSKSSIRNNISLVNQFPYIFDASIKDNLLYAKANATDEEIIEACKKAYLWEFIEELPKKINTVVGENGIKLSGGQLQRLAIARALLRNTRIIIFDESTSSLDNFAQNAVKKSIEALKGNATVIIVAHRLTTIKNSDIIFYLEDGQIIDSGSFDYLFSNNESFQNLFNQENI